MLSDETMKKIGALCACFALVMYIWPEFTTLHYTVFSIFAFLILVGKEKLVQIYNTFWRDARALFRFLRLKRFITWARRNDMSVPAVFQLNVKKHPNKIAFYFEEETWTFQQVEDYSNKVANYFRSQGVKHGDSVALMMSNRVEYVCIWLGLVKLGAVPAFLNTNLRGISLSHCIKIVNSIGIIFSSEYNSAIKEIEDDIKSCQLFKFSKEPTPDEFSDVPNLHDAIQPFSIASPPELAFVHFTDKMVYIYTSGTTGLPKAAVVKHSRCFLTILASTIMLDFKPTDIAYSALPMYHMAAGIQTAGQALLSSLSVVFRVKFSASSYWKDCIKYNVTVAQYIGELCRYLLNTPPRPEDTMHKVKIMYGNGLRPQVWKQFQDRFKIKKISEFYGSTEGNANIINMEGKQGAIGFVSVIIPNFYPCTLIKIDPDTDKPVRGPNGLCVICKAGEPGEFVGRIVRNDPVRDFHGYADKKATEGKVVSDVWKKGDLAFLSGDILVMDAEGYLYFRDRRGDTFRWKGENVSTTEVEGLLSGVAVNSDVAVYGVEVPGSEGRAGMATILDPERRVDIENLAAAVNKVMPSYARPLFLRIVKELDMTGTFKLKKTVLKKEGYDVTQVSDELYYLHLKQNKYLPLNNEAYEQIQSGKILF